MSHRIDNDAVALRDVLAHLTFTRAAKLLGEQGKDLLSEAGNWHAEEFDPGRDARFAGESLILDLEGVRVTFALSPAQRNQLAFSCSACPGHNPPCRHVAAAFSTILEEKTALGLAKPPPPRVPVESLPEDKLIELALAERRERGEGERLRITPPASGEVWGDYAVFNPASGKTYRVSLRGRERGESFCECPDFRKNTLGTCKHILRVLDRVGTRRLAAALANPWKPSRTEVYLDYSSPEPQLRLNVPERLEPGALKILAPFSGRAIEDVPALVKALRRLAEAGTEAAVFPDALEHIQRRLLRLRLAGLAAEIRRDPARHPLRRKLLKTELLPYQLDGIAFAAGAGRAILADDMGLGKTIQGIGVAEILAREAGVRRVLVICPASLKAQWREEIARFSDRGASLIPGSSSARDRGKMYGSGQFFTICNYEQARRDLRHLEKNPWDLIILDEAQRIKNWETATNRVVNSLRSRFALALTGTPMENRLEELYTVASFVDEHRLGPAFRFLNRHRLTDEKGRVLGYRRMGELRERLRPILLRRTREMVMRELPPRHTEILRIPPSQQQLDLHDANLRLIRKVVAKSFISEMDLLRLRIALLRCRLAANGTFLVDREKPGYSTKLEELETLLARLLAEKNRKIIVFSEWTTMLDLVEPLLKKFRAGFARLDGQVPQAKRQALVNRFRDRDDCPVFLATNAGSTGLNLQAANTVINLDLPWNPAVLEQRISRAHRMGQKRPVQVFLLVTEATLEEKLLGVLETKRDLALAALDSASEVDAVAMATGIDELKNRLERLLGEKPAAPVDLPAPPGEEKRGDGFRSLEGAGGKLLAAAADFLGELLPPESGTEIPGPAGAAGFWGNRLREALDARVEIPAGGPARFSFALPGRAILGKLAAALAEALK
ncbi:MAG: DEAD/DEAH box helicase [Planctomycetota bacterium]|jgi:superfamily II DNA or RNA helicase|nr:DEAD/DEAH box helicase [Planctomycetota bacterium]